MSNTTAPSVALDEATVIATLGNSLYPNASTSSISMVVAYCKASGLDPFQKPVHIVPMWDRDLGRMRDVVMPGIGLYRTQAARTGAFAGMSEPEYGEEVTKMLGGESVSYPTWCKVVVKRLLPSGIIAEFPATERWTENYAIKGGKEKSIAPNAMWARRPYAQLAKCAEAQALRKAFPELGAAPTAEEMEGKYITIEHQVQNENAISDSLKIAATESASQGMADYQAFYSILTKAQRAELTPIIEEFKATAQAADKAKKEQSAKAGIIPINHDEILAALNEVSASSDPSTNKGV